MEKGIDMYNDIFDKLFDELNERRNADPSKSYTAKLLQAGTEKINSKIMEEAQELCEAGLEDDNEHTASEIQDLLYHAFVLAVQKGISLDDIRAQFAKRFGMSGIEEKANRGK